jgi:DHA1 family inner membrane transport protein
MLGLAAALTLFNALTFLMPSFELIAASRLLAGLPHGAYFGIGALVAADVLGPGSRAKGAAFVLTGLTLANVVGVPLGTFLGQQLGWRIAFAIVAGIFALATVLIRRIRSRRCRSRTRPAACRTPAARRAACGRGRRRGRARTAR